MPFASGQRITPARLNALQPKTYYAIGSGTVPASTSNGDVPSASVTFTTTFPGAVYVAHAVWDCQLTGATTALLTARIKVDGTFQPPLAVWSGQVATDRGSIGQNYRGTLAAAGSHTIGLVASTAANQVVQGVNSSVLVTIYEVV